MAGAVFNNGTLGGYTRSTVAVASAVTRELLTSNIIPGVPNLTSLPIHLIGHSRGGSLVAEMAKDLALSGIWVDQLTMLDPHPVNSVGQGGFWGDSDPVVSDNVVFADDVWRSDGFNPSQPFDFDGRSVSG